MPSQLSLFGEDDSSAVQTFSNAEFPQSGNAATRVAPFHREAFTYRGVIVRMDEKGRFSLTDIYRAANSSAKQNPYEWSRKAGKGFIDSLAASLDTLPKRIKKIDLIETVRGKGVREGTWAHKQIALAYAKAYDHELHRLVNDAFFEWSEEAVNPDLKADRAIAGYRRQGRDSEWIGKRLGGKVKRHEFTDTLKVQEVKGRGYELCTDNVNQTVLGGKAAEIKRQRGVPARRSLRDAMTGTELIAVSLAESLAKDAILQQDARGNQACAAVCLKAGAAVGGALRTMQLTGASS